MSSAPRALARENHRARRGVAAITAVAVVAAQALAIVILTTVAGPVSPASAVPGQPGVPSPGTPLFSEDFEATPDGSNTLITSYTGATGEHYTADPNWANYPLCDGFVIDQTSAPVAGECMGGTLTQQVIRSLVAALGEFQGEPADNTNAGVASYTAGTAGAGVVFKTVEPIPLASSGRFLTFSVLVGVQNCARDGRGPNDPLYNSFLLDGATRIPVNSTALNPCDNPMFGTTLTRIGTVTAPQPILFTGSTVGLEFDNSQPGGAGNDAAFDNVQLQDVSPQLDKSFAPATVTRNGVSRLTFTVTNSSDLFAKTGWSFSDALPAGVVVAPTPGATTTCTGAAVTAAAGSGTVSIANGSLTAGQASCTVGVNVTAANAGSYTNSAANITSTGLLPPGATTLDVVDTDFGDAPASYGTGTASNTATDGLTIGATRDDEVAANISADATGDDTTGIDDEDGLTGVTSLRTDQPMSVTVPVVNTTGAAATLAGWVDFNRDGDFTDAGEGVTVAVPAGATSATLAWPAQAGGVAGASFIRLRLMPGTVAAPSATAPIVGGEIEDHQALLTIPSIALVKSAGAIVDANGDGRQDAGDTITYGFAVTNTGTSVLDPVTVSDPKIGAVTCPAGPLAPGATVNCTAAPFPIGQVDVDGGSVANTATATGVPPTGAPVQGSSSTATPVTAPALSALQKTAGAVVDANGDGVQDAGDTVAYTLVATNTGAVTLNPVTVVDTLLGPVTCPTGPVAPAASVNCTSAPYTLTQADLDAALVHNEATATGVDPSGGPVTATGTADVPLAGVATIGLVKHALPVVDTNGDGQTGVGDTISWTFDVTNTGALTIHDVSVTDALAGAVSCPPGALAPGATTVCTSTTPYVITQADVDAGSVQNTATSAALDPTGDPVASGPSSTVTPVAQVSSLALVKHATLVDADGDGFADAGETVDYTFAVTNTGTTTLDTVTIADSKLAAAGVTISCPAGTLAPAASVTCSAAAYVVTPADVARGEVSNTATASATGPGGPVQSDPSSAQLPVQPAPALAFTGAAPAGAIALALLLLTGGGLAMVARSARRKA